MIAWYDNIPVLSWLFLTGKCRSCHEPISFLYILIECFTALSMSLLFVMIPLHYFPAYFIFFSALIVTIRSDLETMLISRFATVYSIPIGLISSLIGFLPITFHESMIGCMVGYAVLYLTGLIFRKYSGKDGLGQGDLDLLAFIGAFVGPFGCWITLLIGSLIGSCIGLVYLFIFKPNDSHIPFGPFLALGAISYVLLQDKIILLFF